MITFTKYLRRKISFEKVSEIAQQNGAEYMEADLSSNLDIEKVFLEISTKIITKR